MKSSNFLIYAGMFGTKGIEAGLLRPEVVR